MSVNGYSVVLNYNAKLNDKKKKKLAKLQFLCIDASGAVVFVIVYLDG